MSSTEREKLFLSCFFLMIFNTRYGSSQDFGYDGNIGPNHWGEKYHQCVGKHQSPINIEEHNVEIVELPRLYFVNFDESINRAELHNNGHTVVLNIKAGPIPLIFGGPLIGKYQFAQLHFHWGANDAEGSENKINNGSFPMELHMVFFKTSYGSFKEALEHPDGLCVLSFLYSTSEETNTNYDHLIETLPKVEMPKSTTFLMKPFTLNDLTVEDKNVYFTYGGSLTTPPCSEVVTWIEFRKTIPLAAKQIQYFRQLNDLHGKLLHNFRPVQPLYGRTIRMNVAPDTSLYRYLDDSFEFKTTAENPHNTQNNASSHTSCGFLVLLFLFVMFRLIN